MFLRTRKNEGLVRPVQILRADIACSSTLTSLTSRASRNLFAVNVIKADHGGGSILSVAQWEHAPTRKPLRRPQSERQAPEKRKINGGTTLIMFLATTSESGSSDCLNKR